MGQAKSRQVQDADRVAAASLDVGEPSDNSDRPNEDEQDETRIPKTARNSTSEQDKEPPFKSPTVKTFLVEDKALAASQVRRHYGTLTSADCDDQQLIATGKLPRLAAGRRRQSNTRAGHLVNRSRPDTRRNQWISSRSTTIRCCGGQSEPYGACNCCCPAISADRPPCCNDQSAATCDNQCHAAAAAAAPIFCESDQYPGLVGYGPALASGDIQQGQTLVAKLRGAAAGASEQHDKLVECHRKLSAPGSSLSSRDETRLALNPISERTERGNKSAEAANCSTHNSAQQVQQQMAQKSRQKRSWRQRHLPCGSAAAPTGAGTIDNDGGIYNQVYVSPAYECRPLEQEDTSQPDGGLLRPLQRPPCGEPHGTAASDNSRGRISLSRSSVSSSSSSSLSLSAAASLLVALDAGESPAKKLNGQSSKRHAANCHDPVPCGCHNPSSADATRRTPPIDSELAAAAASESQQKEQLNSVTGGKEALSPASDSPASEIIVLSDVANKSDRLTSEVSAATLSTIASSGVRLDSDSRTKPTTTIITDETATITTPATSAPANDVKNSNSNEQTDKQGKNLISQAEQQQQQQQQRPASASRGHLAWNDLASKYGRMSRKQSSSQLVDSARSGGAITKTGSGDDNDDHDSQSSCAGHSMPAARGRHSGANRLSGSSCVFHIFCALLHTLFPILDSLKSYSLPGDLLTDLTAGFTVAVLHIPQGMAYGLLSGVEPIYGLYVSFVPVLVMSLMSKSRHVSYGTFAVISMLLVSTVENVRSSFEAAANHGADSIAPNASLVRLASLLPDLVVVTDNHQQPQDKPYDGPPPSLSAIGDLIASTSANINLNSHPNQQAGNQQHDSGSGADSQMGPVSTLMSSSPTSIEILACACLVCGLIHITMSLMHLGVLSLMFSDQLVSSFTTASAIHVLTSQLAGLFDLSLPPIQEELFKIVRIWYRFTHTMLFDGCNQLTGVLSILSIAFLLFIKQIIEPALKKRFTRLTCLPSELVLMAIAITCSWYFRFESEYGVKIIGHVPTGLPEARVARLDLVPYVIKDSLTIALISFAMNLSIAQVYAKKFRYELDANQELFALGTANIVGSFFNCFPCASSLSRSSVQSSLNVRSQLCSLFSCGLVVLIICFFAHILHDLPRSTLSCIIVVALKGILMQVTDLYDNWRLSKLDALVWLLTFLSVIICGVTYGLILGIVASLFTVFLRLLTPNHSILGRLPETDIYVDVNEFANCQEFNGVKIFRFNSALCYLNRTMLKTKLKQLLPSIYEPTGFSAICSKFHHQSQYQSHLSPFYAAATAAGSIGSERSSIGAPPTIGLAPINYLIIDCSALSYCDYSGAATLVELVEDMERERVTVYLAACPLKLIGMLERMKSTEKVLEENVYPTISDAIGQVRYLNHLSMSGSRKAHCISSASLSSSLKRRPAGGDKDQQHYQTVTVCPAPNESSGDKDKTNANSLSSILDVP